MDRRKLALLAVAVPVGALAAAAPAHADGAAVLHANLSPVNQSGAHGTAKVTVKGTRVTVHIESGGLLAHSPHAQHFHIGGQHRCAPPKPPTTSPTTGGSAPPRASPTWAAYASP